MDSTNIVVAVTGGAFYAKAGTALPVNAEVARPSAFTSVGFIAEDGITQAIGADKTELKAWQNAEVVRTVQTSHSLTYHFTMVESNDSTVKLYYADDDATLKATKITAAQSPRKTWILEALDDQKKIRICIPSAQVTERGDVVWKSDTAIAYDMTLTCYPDSTGTKAYIYMHDAEGEK